MFVVMTRMAPQSERRALKGVECLAGIVGIEALLAAQGLDLRRRGMAWGLVGGGRSGLRFLCRRV